MKEFAHNYPKDYPEPESVVAILERGCKVKEIPVVMRERMGRCIFHFYEEICVLYGEGFAGYCD